jgi:hypothetical protein
MMIQLHKLSKRLGLLQNASVRLMIELSLLWKALLARSPHVVVKATKEFRDLCYRAFGQDCGSRLFTIVQRGDQIVEVCAALGIRTSLQTVANFNWCPIYSAKVAEYRSLLKALQ